MIPDAASAAAGRGRLLIWTALVALAAIAWLYLIHLGRTMAMSNPAMADMPGMSAAEMAAMSGPLVPWTGTDVTLTIIMWIVMMIAMMIPSAAPTVQLFAVAQAKRSSGGGAWPTAMFVGGYACVWTAFSIVAAFVQWKLHDAALLSPAMAVSSARIAGVLLMAAGIYQLTPAKMSCLAHCRSPLGFLMTSWRNGAVGAWKMGSRHGTYCLGCCWATMILLFVTGVMSLLWVAALAAFVLIEKVAPGGRLVARIAGMAMIGVGVAMLSHT